MIENASLPGERRFHTRLDLLPLAARTALGNGPAVLLIGEALRLRDGPASEARAAHPASRPECASPV